MLELKHITKIYNSGEEETEYWMMYPSVLVNMNLSLS